MVMALVLFSKLETCDLIGYETFTFSARGAHPLEVGGGSPVCKGKLAGLGSLGGE
jgi:hypothetical protein